MTKFTNLCAKNLEMIENVFFIRIEEKKEKHFVKK